MRDSQERVARFNEERGWGKASQYDVACLKDFLLNICEEVGEVSNIIKWVDVEKQRELVKKYKDEFSDFVGDELFLILKIAYLLDIDAQQALDNTLEEYEHRFPKDKMKIVKHGNPLAGGIDDKEAYKNAYKKGE